MPTQTYREVAFRQFFELLKTPPMSVLGYYKNLVRAFNYLFSNNPDKVRYLEKEIRKVELMIGSVKTPENISKMLVYKKFKIKIESFKNEVTFINRYFPTYDSKTNNMLLDILKNDLTFLSELEDEEYRLVMSIKPKIEMSVIEQYMQNSPNLKSFFKEDGKKISQLTIYNTLNKLVDWMNQEAAQEMRKIRFTQPMR